MQIELTLNGEPLRAEVEPARLLLDFLRDDCGLTGAKRSCEVQVCGACTVLLDGEPVSACCTLAAEADGRNVLTIEGLVRLPEYERIERAFIDRAAVQCGFCTPGILLTVKALADADELGDLEEIREGLAGNLCRCTGYRGILEAVADAVEVAR